MKNKYVVAMILFFGFVTQSLQIQALHAGSTVVVASTLLATVSGVQGVYNVRRDNQVLSQCELDYGLNRHVALLERPLQKAQDMMCSDMPMLDTAFRADHGLCMTEITKKISMFDGIDPRVIWNFELFKNTFPHTDFNSAYCVSKNYMAHFGYTTLGSLKSAIAYQILKVKDDFINLMHLTDLSWSEIKMPTNSIEFHQFEIALSCCHNYYGAYAWLGACGYSSLYNGQRVKKHVVALAKIHAFLSNLHELLSACIDSDDTQLINAQGILNFSIQHVHQVQQRV